MKNKLFSEIIRFLSKVFLSRGHKYINQPKIVVHKETDAGITQLVTKREQSETPHSGGAQDTTFLQSLPEGEYWKQEFPKEIIVLHFTAGYNWKSAYETFKKPGRVATPFIVDVEGPKYIVQLFDEKYWSYHLGIPKAEWSRNFFNDKRSIGIEIVNIGPVWLKDGVWRDYVGKAWSDVDIVKSRNRDADGSVKFPEQQVKVVCDLVNHLCDKWNIPRQVPKDKMGMQLPVISDFKGIVTHQMFREDKYDIGTAWPWETIIQNCDLKEV